MFSSMTLTFQVLVIHLGKNCQMKSHGSKCCLWWEQHHLGENMWSYGVATFLTFLLFYVVEHPRQAFLPARCVHFG